VTHVLDGKRVLVTGGTGSFGQAFTRYALEECKPSELVIFSRDEFKQSEMAKTFSPDDYPIRYFLGDVRDSERLLRAFSGVDYVVHAAALKQVPALEDNPFEAVRTNILGAQNIIEAALERSVSRVVAISTDKAVGPINLYGATKLAMEKLFVAANAYVRYRDIGFAVVRYGNVVGSRGSVIPYFLQLIEQGEREVPVTDESMTRFWITLDQGVRLVARALGEAHGGEVYVPRIPSMSVMDLLATLPESCTHRVIGRRPGEKLHEVLISEDEARRTVDCGDCYVILPEFADTGWAEHYRGYVGSVPEGFSYRSDNNAEWVSTEDMRRLIEKPAARRTTKGRSL
jgi:UDP-N-acetylglucosamine 4,6-dehydratase